jgi:cob(I)alamin adenosyltransferase
MRGGIVGNMKIYTKTGDKGTTGLYGGRRVSKDSPRISAYGDVDELNALLGVARSESRHEPIQKVLGEIQAHLFILGAELASPKPDNKIPVVTASHIDGLERQIDVITESLSPMKNFILPGGSKASAYLHLARTVCRRAERSVVHLSGLNQESVSDWVIVYLNRLSDFLFVLARLANQLENIPDIPWISEKN